jgi:hypothetical protein
MKWHYTTGENFRAILESREIRPATLYVPKDEKPVVWFSTNPGWEPTATKGIIDEFTGQRRNATFQEMNELAQGLVRIAVEDSAAPHGWEAFKRLSGIRPRFARGLYRVAIGEGAKPSQWFASFEPVPISRWLAVELWTPEGWVPMPDWQKNN